MTAAILEYLETNHTKMSQVNGIIEEACEVITTHKNAIYDQIVRKEISNFDEDVEALMLIDDIKYLITKMYDYDFDFYLVKTILDKIENFENRELSDQLDILAEDLDYYAGKVAEAIDG